MPNELSASELTQMLGSLASRRASAESSKLAGAAVAVTPGGPGGRYGRMVLTLPNGQTFEVKVEEL
jgi:hypothetical protein